MKYIIEIKPEYEDSFKGLMILGAKDSNLLVDTLAVENLEEYTPVDIEKIYDTASTDGYQRGLEDAWEAARKVALNSNEGGLDAVELDEIFGCVTLQQVFRKYSAKQTIAKLKAYEEKQKADDEIKRGDEVIDEDDKKFWVTKIHNGIAEGIMANGEVTCAYLNVTERTGRHIDIEKILEEMK